MTRCWNMDRKGRWVRLRRGIRENDWSMMAVRNGSRPGSMDDWSSSSTRVRISSRITEAGTSLSRGRTICIASGCPSMRSSSSR